MKHSILFGAGSLALVLALATTGCSSVRYDDPDKVETVTIDFGSTDLKTIAASMSSSLLASPALRYVQPASTTDDPRTKIAVGQVNNRTSEHIDTSAITDQIREVLIGSGEYRLVANDQGQGALGEQVRFQQDSGRVDPAQAKAFGRQLGADVVIFGNLRSIEKGSGRSLEGGLRKTDDLYYQFVLEAVNIETGEVIWMNSKDIRKTEKRGLFG